MTTFEQGRFDNLPTFPRSDPLGPRHEKDGTVARSYKALGAPKQILEFYRDALSGQWRMVTSIEKLGVGTYRADWVSDGYRLRVSATQEPELEEDDNPTNAVVSQYSLSLEPLASG